MILHVNQLKAKLNELYNSKIDLTDIKNENEIENHFLTRAFTAYTLQVLANTDSTIAASSIIDSFDDNGIDAIYYDKKSKLLWLIQSKWIKSGAGEPDTGEVNKFKNGVVDLIELQFDRFNKKVIDRQDEIIEALEDPLVKINIVLAYTGRDGLSDHNKRIIDDLIDELNDPSEISSFIRFSLKQAHKSLVGLLEGQPIKAELMLSNWGKVEEPYFAIYGTISGDSLSQMWSDYRSRLFSENIRDFLGFSEVNEDLIETIQNEPHNFFFYNNGVTALASKISKKPVGGGDRQTGIFIADDFKIVNGAQTVGSLGSKIDKFPDELSKIKILIRIISLEGCPPEFGLNVTKKTNTQNRIDKRDFVSMDPEQDRIRTELALEGINYHFKRSFEIPKPDNQNFYIEEVVTSVACSLPYVDIAVIAKREVGKLWEDIYKKPYTDIINSGLTATKIIRCVQIQRELFKILKLKEQASSGRNKAFYIHMNRFAVHIIFQKIGQQVISDPNYDFNRFKTSDLEDEINNTIEEIKTKFETTYRSSLVHQVFRNYTKCRNIKSEIIN